MGGATAWSGVRKSIGSKYRTASTEPAVSHTERPVTWQFLDMYKKWYDYMVIKIWMAYTWCHNTCKNHGLKLNCPKINIIIVKAIVLIVVISSFIMAYGNIIMIIIMCKIVKLSQLSTIYEHSIQCQLFFSLLTSLNLEINIITFCIISYHFHVRFIIKYLSNIP